MPQALILREDARRPADAPCSKRVRWLASCAAKAAKSKLCWTRLGCRGQLRCTVADAATGAAQHSQCCRSSQNNPSAEPALPTSIQVHNIGQELPDLGMNSRQDVHAAVLHG